jgi:hypothetical protein
MKGKQKLEEKVARAAEAALADHQYVSLIDVLVGIRFLSPNWVASWRRGQDEFLKPAIQGSEEKILNAVVLFQQWARDRGLIPSEARYTRQGREGSIDLKFTVGGEPEAERLFRTHYVSPALSQKQKQKLEEKISKPPERVAFMIARDSACSECGTELFKHDFLTMDGNQALCLQCAGLGDLEFLGAGDAAMTRRAKKYSQRSAVVLEFSRSRGRYERQGLLVEVAAIERAEQECASDADDRSRQRAKSALARKKEDQKLVEEMTRQIESLFPGCPADEARRIAAWTAERGSGRVGRSAAGRKLDDEALTLAVRASVRHNHTKYDELLAKGVERSDARELVRERMDGVIARWRA